MDRLNNEINALNRSINVYDAENVSAQDILDLAEAVRDAILEVRQLVLPLETN